MLPSRVLTVGHQPVTGPGDSRDVYEGSLSGSKVRVKRVRLGSADSLEEVTKVLHLVGFLSSVAEETSRHSKGP